MTAAAAGLAGVAALLLVIAWLLARTTGVRAAAPLIASDVGIEVPDTLVDPALRLRGRPDYLVRERGRGRIYPVEVKPTRASQTLYESDALQLAAYMMLTEVVHGTAFAGYGLVRYRSVEFRVPLDADLRGRCLAAAAGVRAARAATAVHRSHNVAVKCRACAVRFACDEALT